MNAWVKTKIFGLIVIANAFALGSSSFLSCTRNELSEDVVRRNPSSLHAFRVFQRPPAKPLVTPQVKPFVKPVVKPMIKPIIKPPSAVKGNPKAADSTGKHAYFNGVKHQISGVPQTFEKVKNLNRVVGNHGLSMGIRTTFERAEKLSIASSSKNNARSLIQTRQENLQKFEKSMNASDKEAAAKYLFHAKKAHKALIPTVIQVARNFDVIEKENRNKPAEVNRAWREVQAMDAVAKDDRTLKDAKERIGKEYYKEWKAKNKDPREHYIERNYINGKHTVDTAVLAGRTAIAVGATVASGGLAAPLMAARVSVMGGNIATKMGAREAKFQEVEKIKADKAIPKEQRQFKIEAVEKKYDQIKAARQVVFATAAVGLTGAGLHKDVVDAVNATSKLAKVQGAAASAAKVVDSGRSIKNFVNTATRAAVVFKDQLVVAGKVTSQKARLAGRTFMNWTSKTASNISYSVRNFFSRRN